MEFQRDQPTSPSHLMAETASRITDHAMRMTDHAVSTVHIIITAEERLRQRIRSGARVALATIFFAISGLIS